jgi:carbamoyl-phosphate synthase large subunit
MPRRTDIKKILLIGSGPIVIGQACEFDYSGTQAIKALKEEGYEVVLVNSNPATIMTDPEFAHKTYIEPITPDFVERVIEVERPDAVIPTMGGQTALNVALELDARGTFKKYGCELIGAKIESIQTAEDRELFRQAMDEIGLSSAKSGIARSVKDAEKLVEELGYPLILRPSRTLGGTGGGIVHNAAELKTKVAYAISESPNKEVLIEESLIGWKEIELEVMRDLLDNVVIVCSIENLDPMGVHTGDSITVAPVQTLTDKEYQELRDAAIKVIRRIGVETGGSNVQFAVNPVDGRIVVIEMNPRVSRSSALASKATGFPIAKFAAKLAVGYTLDEISNDITRETPACFEPSIDYVVVKIPRFNFEKFPRSQPELGTQMKSVGEVLAFGRNFSEALQKAICSMELGTYGFDYAAKTKDLGRDELLASCAKPSPSRLWYVAEALRIGHSLQTLYRSTGIDQWFLAEMQELIHLEEDLRGKSLATLSREYLFGLKRAGLSDRRIAHLLGVPEDAVRSRRGELAIKPTYKLVDTCAAEFEAFTPYLYSSYETLDAISEAPPSENKKVIILGSGPNRIGQGIEFDYCCVHAVLALRDLGIEAIMVNCNPETVSTDYDISDRLYFEPLTVESVHAIAEREKPLGVVVQFGGQTPLKIAAELEKLGIPILGTSVASIDKAEDREQFAAIIKELGIQQPEFELVRSLKEAESVGQAIGYPVMLRPSFVLGGRAMRVVYSNEELQRYMAESVEVSEKRPVLVDRFLLNAIEVDVDAVSDGNQVLIAGVMEHIERAGIHSGDSSCCLPPYSLTDDVINVMKSSARKLAEKLQVVGLLNVQFAVIDDLSLSPEERVYVLEANPRASRTIPFVSKATGKPWARIAAAVMSGQTLADLGVVETESLPYYSVKACVFPFSKFSGEDTILGPEMKSTGEVMGIHETFEGSFAKSQYASGVSLPLSGTVFLSLMDRDKQESLLLAKELQDLGFSLIATGGTAEFLSSHGITVEKVRKVREGSPHIVDLIGEGKVAMVINTPEATGQILDSRSIRIVANELKVPTYTTVASAASAVRAIKRLAEKRKLEVIPLQVYHSLLRASEGKSVQ